MLRALRPAEQYESKNYCLLQRRLGERVLALRTARGWTQAEAAHRCGMSTWQFQRVETAITNATFTTLARLMDGFAVEVDALLSTGGGATPAEESVAPEGG